MTIGIYTKYDCAFNTNKLNGQPTNKRHELSLQLKSVNTNCHPEIADRKVLEWSHWSGHSGLKGVAHQ